MLEDILSKKFYRNTVEDWAISIGIILVAIVLNKLVRWVFINIIKKITSKTKTTIDDTIVNNGEKPLTLLITLFIIRISLARLAFTPEVTIWINKLYAVIITLNITWLIVKLVDGLFQEYAAKMYSKEQSSLSNNILPLINKGIRIGIWLPGIILALHNADYNVGTLIAGLGIGGLAMAMAAKDSLSNIFGGITILADRPFKLNDRIKIGDYDGQIIDIGIRSTRMRRTEGTIVVIPNARFTESIIENISLQPSQKTVQSVKLSTSNSSEQIQQAIETVKDILSKKPELEKGSEVTLNEITDLYFNLNILYYVKNLISVGATQTKINMELLAALKDKKIELASPPSLIYPK